MSHVSACEQVKGSYKSKYTIHKYKYTMHNTQIQILPGGDVSAREQEVQGLQERDLQRPGLSQEQRQSCSSDCWESVIMIIMIFIMIMIIIST